MNRWFGGNGNSKCRPYNFLFEDWECIIAGQGMCKAILGNQFLNTAYEISISFIGGIDNVNIEAGTCCFIFSNMCYFYRIFSI